MNLFIQPWASCLFAMTILCVMPCGAADPLDRWQSRSIPGFTNNINGVTYGNGRFVAVGAKGQIGISSDGAQWSLAASGTTRDLNHVTSGNGIHVVVGGSDTILVSSTGQSWTTHHVGAINGSLVEWRGVTFAQGKFVAVGTRGATATSGNGRDWTYHDANTAAEGAVEDRLRRITSGGGLFVGVGSGYSPYRCVVITSLDGNLWISRDGKTSPNWLYGVSHGQGRFVAVGEGGVASVSTDGLQWSPKSSGISTHLWGVVHGAGGFVCVGDGGRMRSSTNGEAWVTRTSGTSQALFDITFGHGTYLAVGRNGTVIQSDPYSSAPADNIVITEPERNGNRFQFRFTGTVGATYQIQQSSQWGSWTTVSNVVCTTSPMPCAVPASPQPSRFYRVIKP